MQRKIFSDEAQTSDSNILNLSLMLNQIAIAAIGFSIIALSLLVFQNRTESKITKFLGKTLLCILMVIQFLQALSITGYLAFENTVAFIYLLLLGLVGPVFYLYSQHVIQTNKIWARRENWHFLPAITFAFVGSLFSDYFTLAYCFMFLLGGGYMARLAWYLYQLRERRSLFKMEFVLTASFLIWAIAVVFVGVFSHQLMDLLIPTQAIMLALAIAAAVHIQLNYPHLLSSLEDIASRQYQTSTLLNVDNESVKHQLEQLMSTTKVYQDSELSLASLAEMLSLKPHQLSELINIQLGMSFSSYLRSQRVKAAEILLKTEPEASVLAIGLAVGFRSQSTFYSAFKEIHAIAPGQYRRQILAE